MYSHFLKTKIINFIANKKRGGNQKEDILILQHDVFDTLMRDSFD